MLKAFFAIKGDAAFRDVDAAKLERIERGEQAPDMTARECWALNPFKAQADKAAEKCLLLVGEERSAFLERMGH